MKKLAVLLAVVFCLASVAIAKPRTIVTTGTATTPAKSVKMVKMVKVKSAHHKRTMKVTAPVVPAGK